MDAAIINKEICLLVLDELALVRGTQLKRIYRKKNTILKAKG
jgi:hypothetical protein